MRSAIVDCEGGLTNEIVIQDRILSPPAQGIVLTADHAGGHESIEICSDGVETVVD